MNSHGCRTTRHFYVYVCTPTFLVKEFGLPEFRQAVGVILQIAERSEANDLRNVADSEQIRFALGEAENTHDLLIAQTKALTAMQYTVAVRDKALEAYKEIMNMQI